MAALVAPHIAAVAGMRLNCGFVGSFSILFVAWLLLSLVVSSQLGGDADVSRSIVGVHAGLQRICRYVFNRSQAQLRGQIRNDAGKGQK